MTQTDLNNSIVKGLDNVYTLSEQVYDYWYSELYTVEGEPIQEMFTARTLKLIEDDVMNLSLV